MGPSIYDVRKIFGLSKGERSEPLRYISNESCRVYAISSQMAPYLQGVLRARERWLSDQKTLAKVARTKLVNHKSIF